MICGNCGDTDTTVEAVRDCYAQTRAYEAQSRDELAAELRNEEWFESRGRMTEFEPDTIYTYYYKG